MTVSYGATRAIYYCGARLIIFENQYFTDEHTTSAGYGTMIKTRTRFKFNYASPARIGPLEMVHCGVPAFLSRRSFKSPRYILVGRRSFVNARGNGTSRRLYTWRVAAAVQCAKRTRLSRDQRQPLPGTRGVFEWTRERKKSVFRLHTDKSRISTDANNVSLSEKKNVLSTYTSVTETSYEHNQLYFIVSYTRSYCTRSRGQDWPRWKFTVKDIFGPDIWRSLTFAGIFFFTFKWGFYGYWVTTPREVRVTLISLSFTTRISRSTIGSSKF